MTGGPPVPARTPTVTKRVAILQSNYIPWKGYFDLIGMVDEFFLYDDVQYTRLDWRNRNRVKTRDGLKWLTIPVVFSGDDPPLIQDVRIADDRWARKHWTTLAHSYARAPFFRAYDDEIESLYTSAAGFDRLADVNRLFIVALCRVLGIGTTIRSASEYELGRGQSARLVELCRQAGATEYLSGPAARAYLDVGLFDEADVRVEYMDYSGYPEYPQLFPPFEHAVSVLDLLFNTGPEARRFLKSPA